VIGAGWAGLGVSHALAKAGLSHRVLERGRIGETWLTQRWDSFHLNTPKFHAVMPGDLGEGGLCRVPNAWSDLISSVSAPRSSGTDSSPIAALGNGLDLPHHIGDRAAAHRNGGFELADRRRDRFTRAMNSLRSWKTMRDATAFRWQPIPL
jgi:hypothetical protein